MSSYNSDTEERKATDIQKNDKKHLVDLTELKLSYKNIKFSMADENFEALAQNYESLLKLHKKKEKSNNKDNLYHINAFIEIEEFVKLKLEDKINYKKLHKNQAVALNSLNAKIKKSKELYNDDVETVLRDVNFYKIDLSSSEEEEEAEDEISEESLSDDSEDEFDDTDEWPSSEEQETEEEVEEVEDFEDKHQRALRKWGLRETAETEQKTKKAVARQPNIIKKKEKEEKEVVMQDVPKTEDDVMKAVSDVIQSKKKGGDNMRLLNKLYNLLEVAENMKLEKCKLEILSCILSSYIDGKISTHILLPSEWVIALETIEKIVLILIENKSINIRNNTYDNKLDDNEKDEIIQIENISKVENIRTLNFISNAIQRLDIDLNDYLIYNANTPHVYASRMIDIYKLLSLYAKVSILVTIRNCPAITSTILLCLISHLYYNDTQLNTSIWNKVEEECEVILLKSPHVSDNNYYFSCIGLTKDLPFTDKYRLICDYIKDNTQTVSTLLKCVIYKIYYYCVINNYAKAKELFQVSDLNTHAIRNDITLQIAYNRLLCELAVTAFCNGFYEDSLELLNDLYAHPRLKELLAQSNQPWKTTDKESEIKLVPYHKYIYMDTLQTVINISAMIVDTPSNPQSKTFKKLLEDSWKTVTSCNENNKNLIVAASRALLKSNIDECMNLIKKLKMWQDLSDKENAQAILWERIKQEGLRIFLINFSTSYKCMCIEQLADQFYLSVSLVHSIATKLMIKGVLRAYWNLQGTYLHFYSNPKSLLYIDCMDCCDIMLKTIEYNENMFANKSSNRNKEEKWIKKK